MDWVSLIAEILIPVIGGVLCVFVIPLFRDKLRSNYAKQLVTAAEQLYGSVAGEIKYDYVRDFLKSRWKLSDQQVEVLIESAVGELQGVWHEIKWISEKPPDEIILPDTED